MRAEAAAADNLSHSSLDPWHPSMLFVSTQAARYTPHRRLDSLHMNCAVGRRIADKGSWNIWKSWRPVVVQSKGGAMLADP